MFNDDTTEVLDEVAARVVQLFRPPPVQTVWEWAERERFLSVESAPEPGRYRTARTEYMREPMAMVGAPGVVQITLMTSAQVGKSTVIENVIGYFIHNDPCPILHVSPTLDSMKMFSKERLAPMIRDTPAIRDLVSEVKSRSSSNTIASKTFPGGHIAMVGANAPAGLASRPIRVLLFDEVDRYDLSAGSEGDPVKLATKRTTRYWNRVIIKVSTPGDKTTSRIEPEFENGDQRHFYVPCPHCGEKQRLSWSQVRFDIGDPTSAYYECEHNGCVINDSERRAMVRGGEWVASKAFNGHVSYHISQLYSEVPLQDGVRDFLESKDNPQLLKTWVNTFLGETWEEKGKRLEWSDLMDRREEYDVRDPIPEDVTLITGAVDVQDDRFEAEFVGWGDDYQSWSLGYHVLYGDPSAPEVWTHLRHLLAESFMHPLFGEMVPRAMCIDSGGHYTQAVYQFAPTVPRLMAIKGLEGNGKPIFGQRIKNALQNAVVYGVGVDTAKELVSARLRVEDPTKAGYCRFPSDYDEVYFRGITAEELRTTFRRGFKVQRWQKLPGRANEPFDLRVYNTAALEFLQVDLNAQRRHMLRQKTVSDKPKDKSTKRKTGWVDRWKGGA